MALGLFEQIAAINTKIKKLCCRIDQCCNAVGVLPVYEISLSSSSYLMEGEGWYIITDVNPSQDYHLWFPDPMLYNGKRIIVTNRTDVFINTLSGYAPQYQGFETNYSLPYLQKGYTYEFIANGITGYWSCLSPTPEPVFEGISYNSSNFQVNVPGTYEILDASGGGGSYTFNFPNPQDFFGTTITIINKDAVNPVVFGGPNAIKINKPDGIVLPSLAPQKAITFKSINTNWYVVSQY